MKKIIAALTVFSLLFCLVSCLGTQNDEAYVQSTATSETPTYTQNVTTEAESIDRIDSDNQKYETDKGENKSTSVSEKISEKTSALKTTVASVLKTTIKTVTKSETTKKRVKHTLLQTAENQTSELSTVTAEAASTTVHLSERETSVSDTTTSKEIFAEPTASAKKYCIISINCSTVFDNLNKLSQSKKAFIPDDGKILEAVRIEIIGKETVFDVLKAACSQGKCSEGCDLCRSSGIPLEYSTALTGSIYIKGIHNICEKDCGSKSGWLYKVNGVFASLGCSEYYVKNGDVIEWIYTCNLGKDAEVNN